MRNLHAEITRRIVEQLETGVAPWRKPWSAKASQAGGASIFPRNAVSGRPYSGVNVLLLWAKADDHGYSDGRWLTFKQAKELGGSVRGGEKGTEVVYLNFVERDDRRDPDKTVRIPFLKSYWVFNVAQCDNLSRLDETRPVGRPVARYERDQTVDEFVRSTGARVRRGEPRPYYQPLGDFVAMPAFDAFETGHAYYSTLFHELGHWTGAEHRLNRTFGKRFGDREYAAEELVAELSSAFVCAEFGIDNNGQDAAYLATWLPTLLEFLNHHETALVGAAGAAGKAVEFMRSLAMAELAQAA